MPRLHMPRIRCIKPEFFKHEGLFDLERETGMPMRVAFAGLWTCCDRAGRFRWRPRQLKIEILPYDDLDFSRVLDALTTRGFLAKYTVDGEVYGHIPSFRKHQVINNREAESELPEPPQTAGQQQLDVCSTRDAREDDTTITPLKHAQVEGKGREGKGREGEEIPADLHPLNYAKRLLEDLELPETSQNLKVIAASVEERVRSGMSKPAAYEFLLARAKDDRENGIPINKFWFEDARYRNGNNGRQGKQHDINERNDATIERSAHRMADKLVGLD